jgi:hypothetical protein
MVEHTVVIGGKARLLLSPGVFEVLSIFSRKCLQALGDARP